MTKAKVFPLSVASGAGEKLIIFLYSLTPCCRCVTPPQLSVQAGQAMLTKKGFPLIPTFYSLLGTTESGHVTSVDQRQVHLDEYHELSEDTQRAFLKRRASASQAGTESRGLMENLFIAVQTLNILYERVVHFMIPL